MADSRHYSLRARLSDDSVVDWDLGEYASREEALAAWSLAGMKSSRDGRHLSAEGRPVVARLLVTVTQVEEEA